jgi:hypothetical protein
MKIRAMLMLIETLPYLSATDIPWLSVCTCFVFVVVAVIVHA